MKGAPADPLDLISTCRSQDDSLSASQLAAQHDSKLKDAAAPTAEALGSLMCLMEACLSTGHMPTPEEAITEAQNDGEYPIVHPRTQFCHAKVQIPAKHNLLSGILAEVGFASASAQHTCPHQKKLSQRRRTMVSLILCTLGLNFAMPNSQSPAKHNLLSGMLAQVGFDL